MSLEKKNIEDLSKEELIKINEENLKIIITDLVTIAEKCKFVIESSKIPGNLLEEGYQAMIMCNHVINKWTEDVQ